MLVAVQRQAGIVVEKSEFGTPGNEHDVLAWEHHAHGRTESLGPFIRISDRRGRPVMAAHQRAQIAPTCENHRLLLRPNAEIIRDQGESVPSTSGVASQHGIPERKAAILIWSPEN